VCLINVFFQFIYKIERIAVLQYVTDLKIIVSLFVNLSMNEYICKLYMCINVRNHQASISM